MALARARAILAERLLDETLEVADRHDLKVGEKRAWLEALHWIAAVSAPSRFGGKAAVPRHDAAPVFEAELSMADFSAEELAAAEAFAHSRLDHADYAACVVVETDPEA